ncbi:MAG: hypothetical protein JOS17DRAFT_789921 [Linnemannia elongata]|nr:MAG: hypothetical protein JOS17DRAFT_789921 [Linnemannia elongata]
MDSPTGDFIKSSADYTSREFLVVDNEKQQHQFSSQFFQDLQQQQAQAQAEHQQQQQRRLETRTRRSPKSPSSAYSAWARSQAMASVYILVAGGALCLFFPEWHSGAYSIVLGILVYFIEQKPSSNQSSPGGPHAGQMLPPSSLTPSTVLKAHSIRSAFYIISSVPCFLRAPNYTGGSCLITSGLTYAVAAFLASRKSNGKGKSLSMSQASYR